MYFADPDSLRNPPPNPIIYLLCGALTPVSGVKSKGRERDRSHQLSAVGAGRSAHMHRTPIEEG